MPAAWGIQSAAKIETEGCAGGGAVAHTRGEPGRNGRDRELGHVGGCSLSKPGALQRATNKSSLSTSFDPVTDMPGVLKDREA